MKIRSLTVIEERQAVSAICNRKMVEKTIYNYLVRLTIMLSTEHRTC